MTAAHFAVGLAAARLAGNDWRVALPVAVLSHPVLDLLAGYHPRNVLKADTLGKQLLIVGWLVTATVALCGIGKPGWLVSCGYGLLAWLWADGWWGIRYLWPCLDRYNPHRLWWVRGWEHREELWGLWLEIILTVTALVVAINWR